MYDLFLGSNLGCYRAFEKFKKCSKYGLAGVCIGCPAVAYADARNMYAPDPQCWKGIEQIYAEIYLEKSYKIGVLARYTADKSGYSQIRNISAVHYEEDSFYFFTAKGKASCEELLDNGVVQALGCTKFKEMIRLSGKAVAATTDENQAWISAIFEEQPYLENVYPGETRNIRQA